MTTDPVTLIETVDSAVNRVRTRSLDISFNELFDMHKSRELVIAPDYQRLFRWSKMKRSQFIESLILELPLPPIYAIEIEDGIYELIDGLQRISSYFHFRGLEPGEEKKDESFLVLEGCDVIPELNGLTYDQLPQAIQIKLKRHFIRMEVLRRETDPRLRYHMFKRLNTGGELLSDQEIRNCTIRLLGNRFNDFIKEIVRRPSYQSTMDQLTDEKKNKMYLEEYALRFFAMKNNRKEYVKDIEAFLTSFMEAVSDPDHPIVFDYEKEQKIFERTFDILHSALGVYAFSSYTDAGKPREQFSSTHFEAFTLGLQKHIDEVSFVDGKASDSLKKCLLDVKRDPELKKWTMGGGKNYLHALSKRIEIVEEAIEKCSQ